MCTLAMQMENMLRVVRLNTVPFIITSVWLVAKFHILIKVVCAQLFGRLNFVKYILFLRENSEFQYDLFDPE
jgi:hypothetical protein